MFIVTDGSLAFSPRPLNSPAGLASDLSPTSSIASSTRSLTARPMRRGTATLPDSMPTGSSTRRLAGSLQTQASKQASKHRLAGRALLPVLEAGSA